MLTRAFCHITVHFNMAPRNRLREMFFVAAGPAKCSRIDYNVDASKEWMPHVRRYLVIVFVMRQAISSAKNYKRKAF